MGIPDYLTCLLRNLYAGQEATVRTGHGTDWFQIEKGECKGCILSSCLFNLYAENIMRNAGMEEAQSGIKTFYFTCYKPPRYQQGKNDWVFNSNQWKAQKLLRFVNHECLKFSQ